MEMFLSILFFSIRESYRAQLHLLHPLLSSISFSTIYQKIKNSAPLKTVSETVEGRFFGGVERIRLGLWRWWVGGAVSTRLGRGLGVRPESWWCGEVGATWIGMRMPCQGCLGWGTRRGRKPAEISNFPVLILATWRRWNCDYVSFLAWRNALKMAKTDVLEVLISIDCRQDGCVSVKSCRKGVRGAVEDGIWKGAFRRYGKGRLERVWEGIETARWRGAKGRFWLLLYAKYCRLYIASFIIYIRQISSSICGKNGRFYTAKSAIVTR